MRCLPVAYSMFLGIKDVLFSNQRRIKDVHERLCIAIDRLLICDCRIITLSVPPFFIC